MAYSESEQQMWQEKDQRICKQAMLKAAVELAKNQEEITPENIMAIADKFVAWVYNKTESVVPLPTPVQKEWLDKIQTKYGFTPEQVRSACGSYPSTETEAKEAVKKLN